VVDQVVVVGESEGGLVAVALDSGTELSRLEAGHGFSAQPAMSALRAGRPPFGVVLSNGGTLLAFRVGGAPLP